MVLPAVFLIHSVTLIHSGGYKQDLSFTAATGAPTTGQTVTGTTSHATAKIDTVASPMVVKTVTGAFTPGEVISTATWSATLGTQSDHFDVNRELVKDPSTSTVSCRFVSPQESTRFGGKDTPYIASSPRVLFPAGTTISEGDTITSATLGFYGTFQINSVKQTYEAAQAVVSHITCEIAAAGATGGA